MEKPAIVVNRRIGERVLLERRRIGMTQVELGRLTGTSATTLNSLEHGGHKVSVERLCAIADVLGVSMDYLCGRTEMAIHEKKERG